MKTCLLSTLTLLCFLNASAQEKITTQISTVQLPKGSTSVTTTAFEDYSKRNFKRNLRPFKNSEAFVVDKTLLVTIGELFKTAATKSSLENWKRQLESVYRQTNQTWDVSRIDTINGNRFYIFEEHRDDEFRLIFYSEDVDEKSLNGYIAYKSRDREKAHDYLNNLLKNVKLKK